MRTFCVTGALALGLTLPAARVIAQRSSADTAASHAEEPAFAPTFHAMLFGDASYLGTNRAVPAGFLLGQAVGHVVGSLTDRLAYFGEVTATASATGYALEVERSILRYDFSDEFKISGGRYHTPIGYWNTAYHHGTWLQTTVSRPEMVKYGSQFIPTHFVGAMIEGNMPYGPLGLGYVAGVGNGRGGTISRAGDAGDVNGSRAWTVELMSRPADLFGLQLGGGYYRDRVTPTAGVAATEGTASAYATWQRDPLEVIAEYIQVRHVPLQGGATTANNGSYLQVAYRLPGIARQWKPYARAERLLTAQNDVVFAPLLLGYEGVLGGLRYDFAPYAALKGELRREQFQGKSWTNSFYLNVSFTLPDLGGGDNPQMMHQ
jgi:hypothetical protein